MEISGGCPSLWHIASVGFIPWPRWATTLPPHKTPPFTPIMHLSSRICQTHILSSRHSFTDSIHFFFGLPASRLLTHSLLYLSLIHISEPTRLLSISYAVFCLKKK